MKVRNAGRRRFSRRAFVGGATGLGTAALAGLAAPRARARSAPRWDRETDVVVVGAGASGLPAAIEAKEHGAAVVLIDANGDVGGHAIVSSGLIALGGGSSRQKHWGVQDSADMVFSDLTDWSVIEPNGFPDYRYNDREIIRAFADENAPTVDWLMAHGVIFVNRAPDRTGGSASGNSAPRENRAAAMAWPLIQTGAPVAPELQAVTASGTGLVRPLQASARKLGIPLLLEHRMTNIVRQPASGRVLGIEVSHQGATLRIRARKGVIIATGGHTGNVNFRRIFDPRLTEEYCGVAGEPYSFQDASGEIAAMAVGASLWGVYNQVGEFGEAITKPGRIGCQYGYSTLEWEPGSPIFARARARGLRVRDYQDLILVNQAGQRFYDETEGQFTSNDYAAVRPYVPGSYLNAARQRFAPANYLNAALAGTGEAVNGGGPIWAIFDAAAVQREQWSVQPPYVDIQAGFFFTANTLDELAHTIVSRYQRKPMPAAALQATVARYNAFVDQGIDLDFGKPTPRHKVQTPPFYAAWATPVPHDSRAGVRINARCQVIDLEGRVIPALYCAGESAGGFSQHGLGRCIVQGLIAARGAAAEPSA